MSDIDLLSDRRKLWLENALFRSLVTTVKLLPYDQRLPAMGWVARKIIGPGVGYKRRALENLAMIYPSMSRREQEKIADTVLDGFGRTIIENYSRTTFRKRIAAHHIEGPGYAAALAAKDAGKPIIFSSGHWSNHEATRTALDLAGFSVGGLYKPMANPYFNAHYVDSIKDVSGPIFPRGREGVRNFIKFLESGGHGFLLHDVFFEKGEWFDFLGKPAKTALSAAEFAIRANALLIPYFNTRQPDGKSFKIELLDPIPHGDPRDMTRALIDHLEDRIKDDPGQWLWIHRRWKEGRA